MRFFVYSFGFCVAVMLSAVAWAADKPLSPPAETAAEKLRQALDRVRDVEIADLPLDQAVNQLREQTGLNLKIDRVGVPPVHPSLGGPLSYAHLLLRGTFHDVPLRTALTKLLGAHNLTHVLVGDTVLQTSVTFLEGFDARLNTHSVLPYRYRGLPLCDDAARSKNVPKL